MIEVTKDTVSRLGSCSFCSLVDYRKVYELKGLGCSVRICQKCLDKLKKNAQ